MSADVDLDTVGSCILFYCCDKLLVIYVLSLFTGFMNLSSRPTSRLVDGVGDRGSYGGSPRRNSKGPEPRSSHEFATLPSYVGCSSHLNLFVLQSAISTLFPSRSNRRAPAIENK